MAGDGGLNALSLLPENVLPQWLASSFISFILVKMTASLASIAETWPENVLPQWQQKIALRAENKSGQAFSGGRHRRGIHHKLFVTGWIFCDSNFVQVLDLLIFRQIQPGYWAEVVCHFHLASSLITFYFSENGFETWASIHFIYSAKAVPMNGAPSLDCCKASICGSGKCAASMAAENCTSCRKSFGSSGSRSSSVVCVPDGFSAGKDNVI